MDMKTIIIIFVCATFSLIKPSLAYNDNSTFKNVEQKNTKSINVHSAWSRALPPITPNGAVYLTIDNNSNINDRILAAHSPVAKQVTLHKSIHHGDHLMMEQQHFIDVKANQSFYFEPGGYHLMLISLQSQLKAGQQFPLHLTFAKKGNIEVIVTVRNSRDKNNTNATAEHHH